MNDSRWRFLVVAALSVLVLAVAYGTQLVEFLINQWDRPHYQFFPFVIGAFVWLLWQRLRQAEPKVHGSGFGAQGEEGSGFGVQGSGLERDGQRAANRYDVVVALVVAWLLLGVAYVAGSPWLAYLSFICLVTSAFLQVSRSWRVPYLWGVWLLLWLVLPLPMNRDQQLINWLQALSSKLSSVVLDFVGVIHLMEGNTLILADKQFFVDEACSGIVSVMSIIACAVIYGVWRNRPPLHLFLLAVAGVGWATLMNVLRISVIAMVYQWYGLDWSKGTPHELLGLGIFLCTFLALVSTDYVLEVLLAPVRATYIREYGDPMQRGAWFVQLFDWLQGWGKPMVAGVQGSGLRVQGSGVEGQKGREEEQQSRRAGEWQSGSAVGAERGTEGRQGDRETGRQGEKSVEGERGRGGEQQSSRAEERQSIQPVDGRSLAGRFVLGVVPLVAFAMLAGAQFALPRALPRLGGMPHNVDRALAMDAEVLPQTIGGAERTTFSKVEREYDNEFGNYSRLFEYQDLQGNKYLVSCDFPLEAGGHELTVCYQGIGWNMLRREAHADAGSTSDATSAWGYAEADFKKPDGSAAFLAFCSFDEYGARLTPPGTSLWADAWRTLQRNSEGRALGKAFTVQVWTLGTERVKDDQKRVARELLVGARERFREWVVGGEQKSASVEKRPSGRTAERQRGIGVER